MTHTLKQMPTGSKQRRNRLRDTTCPAEEDKSCSESVLFVLVLRHMGRDYCGEVRCNLRVCVCGSGRHHQVSISNLTFQQVVLVTCRLIPSSVSTTEMRKEHVFCCRSRTESVRDKHISHSCRGNRSNAVRVMYRQTHTRLKASVRPSEQVQTTVC